MLGALPADYVQVQLPIHRFMQDENDADADTSNVTMPVQTGKIIGTATIEEATGVMGDAIEAPEGEKVMRTPWMRRRRRNPAPLIKTMTQTRTRK